MVSAHDKEVAPGFRAPLPLVTREIHIPLPVIVDGSLSVTGYEYKLDDRWT